MGYFENSQTEKDSEKTLSEMPPVGGVMYQAEETAGDEQYYSTRTVTQKFDQYGNLAKETVRETHMDGYESNERREFYEGGGIASEYKGAGDHVFFRTEEKKYAKNGSLTERVVRDYLNGAKERESLIRYDDKGNILHEQKEDNTYAVTVFDLLVITRHTNSHRVTSEYAYDEKGNRVSSKTEDKLVDEKTDRALGKLTIIKSLEGDIARSITTVVSDIEGNKKFMVEEECDGNGNTVKKTVSVLGEDVCVITDSENEAEGKKNAKMFVTHAETTFLDQGTGEEHRAYSNAVYDESGTIICYERVDCNSAGDCVSKEVYNADVYFSSDGKKIEEPIDKEKYGHLRGEIIIYDGNGKITSREYLNAYGLYKHVEKYNEDGKIVCIEQSGFFGPKKVRYFSADGEEYTEADEDEGDNDENNIHDPESDYGNGEENEEDESDDSDWDDPNWDECSYLGL